MKKRVLLVEYAIASIDTIKEILSNPIFSIKVVNEGETAKEYLEKQTFDLMITAAMLPKFHGFNLSQYAAENFPDMKIIIISEIYKGMNYKHQAVTIYKAHDFFEKPFNKDEFKKRIFELLKLDEKTLKSEAKLTTTQIPISDTKKIPTIKKMNEDGKTLTSDDIFGDIIDKVEDIQSYEIEFEDKPSKAGTGSPKVKKAPPSPPITQLANKKPSDAKTGATNKTEKIDQEILDLIKAGPRPKVQSQDNQKFKKIEDDISKKLEDTLSGLGIGNKPSPKAVKKTPPPPEAIKTPQTSKFPAPPPKAKPSKPVNKKDILPDENEKTDEVGVVGYEVLGLIARGGMAEVYKAMKKGIKGFEKVIALKKILSGYGTDAKYIEMFVDEAKIAAELSHPNIVQIYDLGKKDDYYFIAMEYVSGKDLRGILQKLSRREAKMPESLSIYLIVKILEALNYAHSAKDFKGNSLDIVHRDISPPNILVSYNGDIKLTDFGVSKASTKMHQTLAGALKGKLLYMSPEQAKGEDSIDYRSDLYSVGIILYELITGEKLFLNSSEIGTLKKVQDGKITRPSQIKKNIDPELERVILRALNKDKNKRYQKASDMIKDLEAYMAKTYVNMPEPAHIKHFLYDLFKDDIIKDGIEINLSSPPKSIKRKNTVDDIAKPPEPKLPEPPEADHWGEESLTLSDTEPESIKPAEPEKLKVDDFQPIIEINFDDDEVKDKPVDKPVDKAVEKPFKPSPPKQKQYAPFESHSPMLETKKHKNILFILIAVIVVLSIAITLYLVLGSGEDKPDLNTLEQTIPKPATANTNEETKPPDENNIEGSAMSEILSSQPDTDTEGQSEKPIESSPPPDSIKKEPKSAKSDAETVAKKIKKTEKKAESTEQDKPSPLVTEKKKRNKEKEITSEDKGEINNKDLSTQKPEQSKQTAAPQKTPTETKTKETVPEKTIETSEEKSLQTKNTPEKTPEIKQFQPPKPEFKEGDILSPTQLDSQPQELSTPSIRIPRSLRRILTDNQRILVSYLVDHNGNVEIVKVLTKTGIKRLDNLIKDTIKKWKYKPAMKNNLRVKVWKNQWIVIQK